jgi:hypothetical protein
MTADELLLLALEEEMTAAKTGYRAAPADASARRRYRTAVTRVTEARAVVRADRESGTGAALDGVTAVVPDTVRGTSTST